jgi:hypothetical protein
MHVSFERHLYVALLNLVYATAFAKFFFNDHSIASFHWVKLFTIFLLTDLMVFDLTAEFIVD